MHTIFLSFQLSPVILSDSEESHPQYSVRSALSSAFICYLASCVFSPNYPLPAIRCICVNLGNFRTLNTVRCMLH